MLQLPPNWNMILIGGGGLLGGLLGIVTLITKNLVDNKEETIRQLSINCEDWKQKFKDEREKAHNILQGISETLRNIDSGQLDPVGTENLRQALRLTNEYEAIDVLGMYEDCERAGDWIRSCRKLWAKDACRVTFKKHPSLVPWNQRRRFRVDIENYLDWVCFCLYKGGERTIELSDFVSTPVVRSHHPYMAAIAHLVDKGDKGGFGELTPQQKSFLKEALMRLRDQIESRHSSPMG